MYLEPYSDNVALYRRVSGGQEKRPIVELHAYPEIDADLAEHDHKFCVPDRGRALSCFLSRNLDRSHTRSLCHRKGA